MKLIFCRHTWGLPGTWREAADVAREDGYTVLEAAGDLGDSSAARNELAARGLGLIGQAFTAGKTVDEHLAAFRSEIKRWLAYGPRLINVHSGADWFSPADAIRFYREVVQIEADFPVPVMHETHRQRTFFTPWTTRDVLLAVPAIRICADVSHWVCVCERLLDDSSEIIALLAKHVEHIHARVGYEEGPQVPDPSAREYERHLLAHEAWWKTFIAARAAAGKTETTITPEFGPPNYLHTIPHTNKPVADLRQVCNWMKGRLEKSLGEVV